MRFDWPLALVCARVDPARALSPTSSSAPPPAIAIRFTTGRARLGAADERDGSTAAIHPAAPLRLALAAALDRGGAAGCRTHDPARAGDGDPCDRHLGVDGRERRRADAAGCGARGRAQVPRQAAGPLPRRHGRILLAGARGGTDHRRPRSGLAGRRAPDAVRRHGDRRRDRPVAGVLQQSAKSGGSERPSARNAKTPPSAIVLLSDGAQNRGRLQPIQAALQAKRLKVPIYTVALGTANGTIGFTTARSRRPSPSRPTRRR